MDEQAEPPRGAAGTDAGQPPAPPVAVVAVYADGRIALAPGAKFGEVLRALEMARAALMEQPVG